MEIAALGKGRMMGLVTLSTPILHDVVLGVSRISMDRKSAGCDQRERRMHKYPNS